MLDYRDQVIFEHLLANARTQNKELARVLRCSEATIVKRLRDLEQEQYIARYDALVNWQAVPLQKRVYFLRAGGARPPIIASALKDRNVFTVCRLAGDADWQVWCFFRTDTQRILFERRIRPYVRHTVSVDELIFPSSTFFTVDQKPKPPLRAFESVDWSLISVAIMKHLAQGHGRDSLYEISKQLGISYDRVHYHGKRLLASDAIGRVVAQPGAARFGLQTTTIIARLRRVITTGRWKELNKTPRIISSARCDQGKVLMIHIHSLTQKEFVETLREVVEKIRADIVTIQQYVWTETLLNNRYPLELILERRQPPNKTRARPRVPHTK